MKKILTALLAFASAVVALAQPTTPLANIRVSGNNQFLSGSTVTFNAGSALTVNGTFSGAPTGGTLDLTNVTKIGFGGGGGGGGVSSISVTPQNGVSATVANPTTTPALAFTLGNITPTTVNGYTISQSLGGVVLSGLTTGGGGGANNSTIIQAAFPAGVARNVVLPSGRIDLATGIVMAPGSMLTGQGDSDFGTIIYFTGTGPAFSITGANTGAQSQYGGYIAHIRFGAPTPVNNTMIRLSDTFRCFVVDCSFEGAAIAIELQNLNAWTEGARLLSNKISGCYVHYKFTIPTPIVGNDRKSFAETVIQFSSDTVYLVGEKILLADDDSWIYGGLQHFKSAQGTPAASTPTTTKNVLIELGARAFIGKGQLFIFSENTTSPTRVFTRFKLGAGASICGFGYQDVAPAGAMVDLVGAAVPMDDLAATSALYLGPSGEFIPGTQGSAKVGAGQMIFAGRAATTNSTIAAVYLPASTIRMVARYVGTGRVDVMSLRVSAHQGSNITANSSSVLVTDFPDYNNTPVFSRVTPPYLKFTSNNNPVLYFDLVGAVSDGVFYITTEIESLVNTGSSDDFGTMKPIVIFPDMTGISVGSPVTGAFTPVLTTLAGAGAISNGKIAVGNSTSGQMDILTLTGTNVTITQNSTTLNLASTGGGNGTGNITGPTMTANAVVLGAGSQAITVLASLGTSGQTLISAGTGAPPAFGVTTVPGGGTGLSTITANVVLTGNGTGSLVGVAPGTSGNILTSNGTAWTSAAAGAGSGNVTNNATLATGNIVIGGGTTVVSSSNMSWNATNNTLTVPNLAVTTNQTIGNLSITNLTVSGNILNSSVTDGQIYIGNNSGDSLQLGTLTAGTGIAITNAAGAITINATGGTSITANYIGYGNATNALTGEAAFQYNPSTNIATIGGITLGAGSEVSTVGPFVDAVDGTTPLNNINQVVATGTAYTLTTSYAAVDFGTTDPVLTIANAGTYSIYVNVQTSLVSATTTTQAASFKLRRTNNTAADLTGSTFGSPLPVATTTSELGPTISIGPIKYTTSNTDDSLTVQGILSASLGAGTATVTACTITAIRAY